MQVERVKGIEPSSLSPALVLLIIRGFHMGERPSTRRLLLLLLLLLINLNQGEIETPVQFPSLHSGVFRPTREFVPRGHKSSQHRD